MNPCHGFTALSNQRNAHGDPLFFASRRVDSITMLILRQLGTCITTLRLERYMATTAHIKHHESMRRQIRRSALGGQWIFDIAHRVALPCLEFTELVGDHASSSIACPIAHPSFGVGPGLDRWWLTTPISLEDSPGPTRPNQEHRLTPSYPPELSFSERGQGPSSISFSLFGTSGDLPSEPMALFMLERPCALFPATCTSCINHDANGSVLNASVPFIRSLLLLRSNTLHHILSYTFFRSILFLRVTRSAAIAIHAFL